MKNIAKLLAASAIIFSCTACDDLFEPAIENIKDESTIDGDSDYADGILRSAYILMPYESTPVNDVATDDAVSNDVTNDYLSMATGSWTSKTSVSGDNWRNRNGATQFINIFLQHVDNVTFSSVEGINKMFIDRLKGEAYGLRALNMYFLLQNYGGVGTSGELLGVQIWTTPYDATVDMNVARRPFKECLDSLYKDAERALELLPTDYVSIEDESGIPAKYRSLGVTSANYNRVFGQTTWGRMSGRIVEAVRAQAALLAASPAFQASGASWEEAANYAAVAIDNNGGLAGIASDGYKWYTAEVIGNTAPSTTTNHAEIIWRSGAEQSSSLESSNFPPSLYGTGRINPTQNLVDAFPMANGFPITNSSSGYDASNPYANRDPRLAEYIVLNGSTLGVNSSTINTTTTADNNDGINKESGYSTRTGYYLRKLLRTDVNPNSTNTVTKYHYTARIRYTEIYLDYAEAANEAWGPKSSGSHSYSAYDIIKAIRKRAGIIDPAGGDAYLEQAAASKDTMRELIRNERRIELCFENHRFWDLRRWQANLNETARGVEITGSTYKYIDVEKRQYESYMIYGPIPYTDMLKFSNLEQNQGW